MARIGYARVSTIDQHLDLQKNALRLAGCTRIFEDHGVSGSDENRCGLSSMLKALRRGDILIVWRLDRLGRSIAHLISMVETLRRRGIGFISLTESIDTSSPGGKLIFHILAALAEFEKIAHTGENHCWYRGCQGTWKYFWTASYVDRVTMQGNPTCAEFWRVD